MAPTDPRGTSSSTAPPGPSISPPPKPGIRGGTVAGIAIGCLIAGTVIALLAFLLLTRRIGRRRPTAAHYSERQHAPHSHNQNLDHLLPQPVEDNTIAREVSKLRDNIKNHVHTFYQFPASQERIKSSQLADLTTATNTSAAVLADMLSSNTMWADAVRLFIAWSILSRCDSTRQPTLLPADLASVLDTIYETNDTHNTNSLFLSRWKVLTGALLERKYAKAEKSTLFGQDEMEIIEQMDDVLSGFVKADIDGAKRHRNLEMILMRAARLAFLLFSQPGSFQFDFSGPRKDEPPIFPALVQVIGDQAQPLSPPRVLCDGELAADNSESV